MWWEEELTLNYRQEGIRHPLALRKYALLDWYQHFQKVQAFDRFSLLFEGCVEFLISAKEFNDAISLLQRIEEQGTPEDMLLIFKSRRLKRSGLEVSNMLFFRTEILGRSISLNIAEYLQCSGW